MKLGAWAIAALLLAGLGALAVELRLQHVAVVEQDGLARTVERRVAMLEEGLAQTRSTQDALERRIQAIMSTMHGEFASRMSDASQTSRLEEDLHRTRAVLESLTAPGTVSIGLQGRAPAAQAKGRVLLDRANRRVVLSVYELPPASPGKTFQLWVTEGGRTISGGVFGVDAAGRGSLQTHDLPQLDGPVTVVVITEEPEGGAAQPAGPIVMASG
jgi:hypothetical protein